MVRLGSFIFIDLSFFVFHVFGGRETLLEDWSTNFESQFSKIFSCLSKSSKGEMLSQHPLVGLKTDEVIRMMGYPAERISVTTKDGYKLTVFRIPHGKKKTNEDEGDDNTGSYKVRVPVYLNHGMGANGQSYLIQWGNRNLGRVGFIQLSISYLACWSAAMYLADSGFDVFLGNARGGSYSRGHANKSLPWDKYWDFSFDEMGRYDVPAVVDMILNKTEQKQLYYVGHSMGGTEILVALTQVPEMNDKIITAYLMAPGVFFKHSHFTFKMLTDLAAKDPYVGGRGYIDGRGSHFVGQLCSPTPVDCLACNNLFFYMYGATSNVKEFNETNVPYIASFLPDRFSTKCVLHYSQVAESGKFRRFNYGRERNLKMYGKKTPEEYALNNITAPITILYSTGDVLCTPKDIKYLASKISSLKDLILVEDDEFSHGDFALAIHAKELVYDKIVEDMISSSPELLRN